MIWLMALFEPFLATSPRQSEQLLVVSETSWTSHWIFLLFPETNAPAQLWKIYFGQGKVSEGPFCLLVCVYTVIKGNFIFAITAGTVTQSCSPCCCGFQTGCHCWQTAHYKHSGSPETPMWKKSEKQTLMKNIITYILSSTLIRRKPFLSLTFAGASSVVLLDFLRRPENKPPFSCKKKKKNVQCNT